MQQQGMTTPPPVISTKDHLYLQDMLNWNLLAMKKAHFNRRSNLACAFRKSKFHPLGEWYGHAGWRE